MMFFVIGFLAAPLQPKKGVCAMVVKKEQKNWIAAQIKEQVEKI
jgi:hypothetical protein